MAEWKMGYKDRFYSELRKDYEENHENSFLFQYIEKEKRKKIEEEPRGKYKDASRRKDTYVQIRECYLDLLEGRTNQRTYLLTFFRTLYENAKIPFASTKSTAGAGQREMLLKCGLQIGGEHIFDGIKSDRKRYEALIRVLENKEWGQNGKGELLEAGQLEILNKELLNCILDVDVQTFLYDVGHPLNQEKGRTYKSRKKDRAMDMLDAYCSENHIYFGQQSPGISRTSNSLTEKEVKFYEKLYVFLNDTEKTDIIFPIQVDALTGAGLYIMGSDYFPESVWKKRTKDRKREECCCYACFYWSDLGRDEHDLGMEFRWGSSEDYDWEACCSYPDIWEAWEWYQGDVKEFARDFFTDYNGRSIWEAYTKGIWDHDWSVFEENLPYDWDSFWDEYGSQIREEMKEAQREEEIEIAEKRKKRGQRVW